MHLLPQSTVDKYKHLHLLNKYFMQLQHLKKQYLFSTGAKANREEVGLNVRWFNLHCGMVRAQMKAEKEADSELGPCVD